jgi:hypothetical protein
MVRSIILVQSCTFGVQSSSLRFDSLVPPKDGMSAFEAGFPKRLLLFALVVGGLVNAEAQRGAITVPRNLSQLIARAATVVQGRVSYAREESHPRYHNLHSIVVTVLVEDVWKGAAGKSLTFRQFIWDPRDSADRAGYREGEELVLFLSHQTSAGFTSPVGLEQGRFRVLRDSAGATVVVNGANNNGLFDGMQEIATAAQFSPRARRAMAPKQLGPVPLDVLKELVRGFSASEASAK